jgi:PAS domain S-box-containing protein
MPDSESSPIAPRHRHLLHVVETMNCGLLASDIEGVVRYANPRLLRWLGYDWDEVVDQPATPEHAELHRAEIEAIQQGDLRVRLVVLRRKDTTTFPALVVPQRFHGEDEALRGTFSIIIDLGAVQTAKRIGIASEPTVVTTAVMEIVRQLETLHEATGPAPRSFDRNHPSLADLSPREFEVLEHLLVGERVSVIATNLFISEHTVRNHLKSIFRKTGTNSQAELVPWVRSLD